MASFSTSKIDDDDLSSGIPKECSEERSIVEGFIDLDLNRKFIQNRAATHLFIAYETHIEGILPRDVLVIDRSLQPKNGNVILADIDGEYTLRRLVKHHGALYLVTDTGNRSPFLVDEERGILCGVITYAIHDLLGRHPLAG